MLGIESIVWKPECTVRFKHSVLKYSKAISEAACRFSDETMYYVKSMNNSNTNSLLVFKDRNGYLTFVDFQYPYGE